ncbi:YiiX/YebB-like N1pC/P60 family cysteine hydrolase [Shigella flexneri]
MAQTAKRCLGKPSISASGGANRQYCSEVVWKAYQNALGMRVGERRKLEELNLATRWSGRSSKNATARIPLEETVTTPKPFSTRHNSPRFWPKNAPFFEW